MARRRRGDCGGCDERNTGNCCIGCFAGISEPPQLDPQWTKICKMEEAYIKEVMRLRWLGRRFLPKLTGRELRRWIDAEMEHDAQVRKQSD